MLIALNNILVNDVDDPNNRKRGGIVFDIKLDLMKGE